MFGLGPATLESGRSYYGMTETIAGASAVRPIHSRLNIGLYGEINGRSVDVRPGPDQVSPSIEQLYGPADAPGLSARPFFLQLASASGCVRLTRKSVCISTTMWPTVHSSIRLVPICHFSG